MNGIRSVAIRTKPSCISELSCVDTVVDAYERGKGVVMRNFGLGVGVGETRKARSVASNKTALSNTVGRTVGLGVGMGAYVAVE